MSKQRAELILANEKKEGARPPFFSIILQSLIIHLAIMPSTLESERKSFTMNTIENLAEDIRQHVLNETAAVMAEYHTLRRYQTANHYNEVRLAFVIKFTLDRLNSTEKRTELLRYFWDKWMRWAFIAYTGLDAALGNPNDKDIVDGAVTSDGALICMVRVLYWILKYRTNYGAQVATWNAEQLISIVEILSYIKVDERVREHLVSNFGNTLVLTTNALLNPDNTPRMSELYRKKPMNEGQIYQPIVDAMMGVNEVSAGKVLESIFVVFTDLLNRHPLVYLNATYGEYRISVGYGGQEYWENNWENKQLCVNVTITVIVTRGDVRRARHLNLLEVIKENNGGVQEAQTLLERFNEKARDDLRQAYYNR